MATLAGAGLGWWAVVAMGIAIVVVVLVMPDRTHFVAYVLVLAAAAVGAWRTSMSTASTDLPALPTKGDLVTVRSEPIRSGRAQYFVARPFAKAGDSSAGTAWSTCVTAGREPVVHVGDVIRLWGNGQLVTDVSLAQRTSLLARGCGSRWYASSMEVIDA